MKPFIFSLFATILIFACIKEGQDTTSVYETEFRTGPDTTYQWYPDLLVFMNVTGTHQIQLENVDTTIITQLPYVPNVGLPYLVEIKYLNGDYYAKVVRDIIPTKKLNYTEIRNVDNKTCINCGKSMKFKTYHRYTDGTKDSLQLYRSGNSPNAGRFLFIKR